MRFQYLHVYVRDTYNTNVTLRRIWPFSTNGMERMIDTKQEQDERM